MISCTNTLAAATEKPLKASGVLLLPSPLLELGLAWLLWFEVLLWGWWLVCHKTDVPVYALRVWSSGLPGRGGAGECASVRVKRKTEDEERRRKTDKGGQRRKKADKGG